MKRNIVICILLLLLTVIAGCGASYDITKDITIEWDNGPMYKGKAIPTTLYRGYEATIEAGNGGLTYNFTLETDCVDPADITVNTQHIETANMDKYKDLYYYTEYLGSKLTAIKKVDDKAYLVCQTFTNGLSPQLIAQYIAEYAKAIPVTNGCIIVDYGTFTFGTGFELLNVKHDYVTITGTAKVSVGSRGGSETYTWMQGDKQFSCKVLRDKKYDFYDLDGYTIQLAKGVPLETYVVHK